MSPTKLNTLNDLVNQFEIFVFDLCGVVHNGVSLYQDTVNFIKNIEDQGRQVVFLSNSPNSREKSYHYLKERNFDIRSKEQIFTSGDFFIYNYIHNPLFQDKSFYFFGVERNRKFLLESGVKLTEKAYEADYIICSFFSSDQKEVQRFTKEVENLFEEHPVPMICANPDIYAPHGEEMRYTPGYFAKVYQEVGGEVIYFGKPHNDIYNYLFNNIDENKIIPKDKILMIGDSMHTDIRGARQVGIKSVLVGGGYHRNINFCNNNDLGGLFLEYNFEPDFFITGLK